MNFDDECPANCQYCGNATVSKYDRVADATCFSCASLINNLGTTVFLQLIKIVAKKIQNEAPCFCVCRNFYK